MPIRQEVRYHLEVPHKPGEFEEDLEYLTSDAEEALGRLKELKAKYASREIKITKTTTIEFQERISESDLEIDVDRALD